MPAYHTYADHYKNNTNCTKKKAKIVKINGSAKIVKINGSGKKLRIHPPNTFPIRPIKEPAPAALYSRG